MQRLLDQEAVLGQFGPLHLITHPHRQHAAAGPLQLWVLLALILGLGLAPLAGTRNAHHSARAP